MNKERILRPVRRIHGGMLLPHLKGTADAESLIMPPPDTVKIPMLQHIGAPAEPVVNTGDRVFVGTLIGKAAGAVSAAVHSSVSGTVKAVESVISGGKEIKRVVIDSDGLMEKDPSLKPFDVNNAQDIANAAAECGLESPETKADIVTNDGAEMSLLVGGASPDGTGTYIKLSTDDKIYITESELSSTFTFDALSLAKTDAIPGVTVTDAMKTKYTDDNGNLSSFDSITVTGKNFPEKVVITPNTDENLSQYAAYMTTSPTKRIADNIDGIFTLFKSGVSVTGAYSFDTSAAARKSLGLDSPDLTAAIKIGDYSLTYSFKQQSDGAYAVWYDGAKLISKVAADSLSFIDYKATNFYASWVCLQSINELSGFTVKTADKDYSFGIVYDDSEDAEETYVITYNGKKLVASDFQSFYQECISLACSDYTVDKINAAPDMTFVFTYSDTSRAATSVEFKKASETKYQYSIDGIDMGKINSSALNKILKQVQKLTAEK